VLGGLSLPHAETHAILLPHVMRFNLDAAPEAKARLQDALGSDDPAAAVAAMLKEFPIPQRLRDVGFDAAKADFVAGEIAAASITAPRPAAANDVRDLLAAAY
jgi:maleylacetate reductase